MIWTTYYAFFLSTEKFPDTTESNVLNKENNSWFQQTNKVFVLVIDGFRFDYITYNQSTLGHEQYAYQNKFKKLYEYVAKCPECYTLLKVHADAPTFTKDRVPTLVTGNIPPKPGMFESFEASKTIEDSVLRQMRLAGKKTYYVGDPVWTELFPDDLSLTTLIRAFDIKDTDVDSGVVETVNDLLKQNDFDLLIAHTLKIDHISHVFGIYDPQMGEQIAKTDEQIAKFIELMDDKTTLIILGDHGATEDGAHGGSSLGETTTVMAAYHKKGLQKYKQPGLKNAMKSVDDTENLVKQQDLAPTLSMLLGVPIPFSSFGQIISDFYPVDHFQDEKQPCQGAAFLTKMLKDNHLNTAQVMNYYNFFKQESHLPTVEDDKNVLSLADEAFSAYKEGLSMLEANQECEESFVEKVTAAVAKGQKLSEEVYTIVVTRNNHDMPLVMLGLTSCVLIMISYALIIQYLYAHGYSKENDKINNPVQALKNLIAPGVVVVGICLTTWVLEKKFRHFMAAATVFLAFWVVGNLLKLLFTNELHKQQPSQGIELESGISKQSSYNVFTDEKRNSGENSQQENSVLVNNSDKIEENTHFLLNLGRFFLLQTPLVSIGAVILIVTLLHCLMHPVFEIFSNVYARDYSILAAPLFIAYRLSSMFSSKKFLALFMTIAVAVNVVFLLNKIDLSSTAAARLVLASLLMGDWVFSEIRFVTTKLGANKLWSFVQGTCFGVLVLYHMLTYLGSSYFAEIILPRTAWVLLLGSIVLKKFLNLEGMATKRNLQLCLIQFLFLLQSSVETYMFVFILTLMRVTQQVLSKVLKPSNHLYSFVMVLLSYFGFIYIGQHDQRPPWSFNSGFVGLKEFNPVFSSAMVFLNVLSCLILGFLFVIYHNQDVELQMPEGEEVTLLESKSKAKAPLLKISARVITKRNIICFLLPVSIIFFAACVRCLVWTDYFFWQARIKYAIDGCIYIFFMSWSAFVLALA